MNRTHPPTYPRRETNSEWLDALGRLIALAVFALAVFIILAAVI